MKRLLIACPLHNGCCDAFRRAYGELMRNGVPGWQVRWFEVGGCGITVARNHAAALAINEGYDAMVFVAADIGFPADACSVTMARVLSHLDRLDVNCVGGVYLFKKFPFQAVVDQDMDREIDEHGLVEVRSTGTDFMAIRISAMRQIIDNWDLISQAIHGSEIPLRYDGNLTNADQASGEEWNLFGQSVVVEEGVPNFLPEDIFWCRLMREAKMKIHVDTKIRLQHWGSWDFDASRATGIEEALTTAMPRHKPSAAFA